MLHRRAQFTADKLATVSWQLANRVRHYLSTQTPGTVALFAPIHNEPDLLKTLAADLIHDETAVCLPRVVQKKYPLAFNLYVPGEPLAFDALGLPCAAGAEIVPQLVVVPCLGFSRSGSRLGYGGGYYDMTFAKYPQLRRIGIATAEQEIASPLPLEPHDLPMHAIITEKEVIECL